MFFVSVNDLLLYTCKLFLPTGILNVLCDLIKNPIPNLSVFRLRKEFFFGKTSVVSERFLCSKFFKFELKVSFFGNLKLFTGEELCQGPILYRSLKKQAHHTLYLIIMEVRYILVIFSEQNNLILEQFVVVILNFNLTSSDIEYKNFENVQGRKRKDAKVKRAFVVAVNKFLLKKSPQEIGFLSVEMILTVFFPASKLIL